MVSSRIRAILFDMDGTLAETESLWTETLVRALRKRGWEMDEEDRAFVVGHSFQDIYEHLRAKYGLAISSEALQGWMNEEKEAVFGEALQPLPGAVEAVRRLGRKWPVALVSGSPREDVEFVLGRLGLQDAFHLKLGVEDYPRGKPAPDGFLEAARRLGVPPEACVVFEDSTAGIRAAKAAGMCCIAVQAGNFSGQDQSEADLVISTLEEAETALERLEAGR